MSGHPRRMAAVVAILVALVALTVPMVPPARAATTTTLGSYAGAIVGAPDANLVRHNDIAATIARLRAAHVNTYSYMIFGYGVNNAATGSDRDIVASKVTTALWNELPAFADAAAAAGIKVWVYLVPPSESYAGGKGVPVGSRTSTYAPFHWDYQRWASEIGKVAQAHPNITGIAIDDFGGNTAEWPSQYTFSFTPSYVAGMRSAARTSAPWLELVPVLYYTQYSNMTSISTSYRPVVDGFIYPYAGVATDTGGNTSDASNAEYFTRITSSMVKCHAGDGCLQLGVPGNTATSAGWYASVEQVVPVTTSATHHLTFRTNDTWIQGRSGVGYHFLQVLVDGVVVWEQDVATYHGWDTYTVDLSSRLQGKTSTRLTLRLYEKAGVGNFPVSAWFDSLSSSTLQITNPGFEGSLSGWTRLEARAFFDESWVPSRKFWLMPYASKLGYETAQPTAAYVGAVTGTGLTLAGEGVTNGTMVYVLPLSDRQDVFDAVAALYAAAA